MTELRKVWVTDTRKKDSTPFLFPQHLLAYTKHVKLSAKDAAGRKVSMPEPVSAPAPTTSTGADAKTDQPTSKGKK